MEQKKCAIYCRVSTVDQNTDRQQRELLEYAERANYEVVTIKTDTISGSTSKRKGRDAVIQLALKRKIDVVLVSELSRWGRSMQDVVATTNELHSRDVSLVCLNGMSFDLNVPEQKFMRNMLASFAELERDIIRERIKSGLANARAKGKVFGRKPGTGKVTDNRIRIKVLTLRNQGESIRAIAKACKLSHTTVQKIVNSAKRQ
jgi:DNA invertase Pin-like site-specific DNA recombinase